MFISTQAHGPVRQRACGLPARNAHRMSLRPPVLSTPAAKHVVRSAPASARVASPDAASPAPAGTSSPAAPQQPAQKSPAKQLCLRSAACNLPHPDKASYGGEDAWFVSEAGGGAIGVADGVGGWAESGINPAEYSRTFMRVACAFIEKQDAQAVASVSSMDSMDWLSPLGSTDEAVVDPRAALDTAHRYTRVPGSATACVVQLCPDRKSLIAANLGDSGFLVVRKGEVVLRSSPLQHFFDCPLQFGAFPEHVEVTDSADNAELFQLPVQPGDVIIAGSDGLWDNAYEHEILKLLPSRPDDVKSAAKAIARLARKHAADPTFPSPYTQSAKAQGYDLPWWEKVTNIRMEGGQVKLGELEGGKMDDITVLVSMVAEVEAPATQPAAAPAVGAAAAATVSGGNGVGRSPAAAANKEAEGVIKATVIAPVPVAAMLPQQQAAAADAPAPELQPAAAAAAAPAAAAEAAHNGAPARKSAAAAPASVATTTTTAAAPAAAPATAPSSSSTGSPSATTTTSSSSSTSTSSSQTSSSSTSSSSSNGSKANTTTASSSSSDKAATDPLVATAVLALTAGQLAVTVVGSAANTLISSAKKVGASAKGGKASK